MRSGPGDDGRHLPSTPRTRTPSPDPGLSLTPDHVDNVEYERRLHEVLAFPRIDDVNDELASEDGYAVGSPSVGADMGRPGTEYRKGMGQAVEHGISGVVAGEEEFGILRFPPMVR